MADTTVDKPSESEIKTLIFKEVPALIQKDPEIRRFILDISSKRFADKRKTEDRIEKILEELRRDREANLKKWEENQRKWEEDQRRWEENEKRWEENQRVINRMLEEIRLLRERQEAESKRLDRRIDTSIGALGARWGFRAEASFRNAIKEILEELLPFRVERYRTIDEEGIVFGKPDQVELDLLIKDGVLIVAEIKSSISKGDVVTFNRKIQVFEKKEGKAVTKKIIISPMVDARAMEFAVSSGIKVYGYPEEIDLESLQV